jgi:F-type H+-transporting ATPase subunit delta
MIRISNPLPLISKFMTLLLEKGRLGNLPVIALTFEELSHQILNRARVSTTTAWQLTPQDKEDLAQRLQEVTGGKEIILTLQVDPVLIGGMVVQVGNTIYDGSIKRQLENLKEKLTGR